PQELFINADDLLVQLKQHSVVEFGQRNHFTDGETVKFNFVPQPVFNKNFDLLFETMKKQNEAGFRNIIFFDTEKQKERLFSIYEDMFSKLENKALPFAEEMGGIHEGFIDKENKLACFTDHQIFERYHRFRLKE